MRSGFIGVSLNGSRWSARISVAGKKISLGGFETEKEAALAYDQASRAQFGDTARCNFDLSGTVPTGLRGRGKGVADRRQGGRRGDTGPGEGEDEGRARAIIHPASCLVGPWAVGLESPRLGAAAQAERAG
ncbi:pathogenesis-related transcriptional factor and erf [Nannochloropsis gaditana CCMP526]|uniref:pathogenesis-related transcriptional factor and erf n=1 Tax=Nannochloropsis gaditana (strain CCMP526) TaxID=1093141 RepID=UPI00029F5096|nr:pathogenesis-related transcriptional factor and erf [Nannochloropsis gaditana CCMP526]EKU23151.1 pathogenesis-related transcriptional factor and erf [Nannochloropsis gaditana CCMP526]|eukprot:XP_005852682.1 pathogenesis-related transcriptional factor and erf [Nannochloropsis gaditana CCMP526]